ncbi:restriction endonuclease subunit S [Clostridium perfringens]|uniref:restriction endonuclease subunit S n=1 Tax=Clostridium perfringens TaxID=1502 RepID=UPI003F90A6FA|nr:restriction endonuclease subunit S [Clostridium perfringens]
MNFKENELIETTLSEISIDGKGSYGISASAVEYSNNLYTYLRITDITDNGKLIKDGLKSVDDENAYKYILKPNDIVFARTGNSTGRSYFYDGSDGELVYAGFLIKFSLDSKKVNPKFMRYYTLSEEYRKWVASFSTGSTRGNINAKTYGNMKIRLPERKQQDFLVEILSDLDEKIEVNNKINKNLEEMAQAIFKQWFVDFEFPNEEGKPYKSSGGEMVESELGMIPSDFSIINLNQLGKIITGKTPSTKNLENFGDEYMFITPKDVKGDMYVTNTERLLSEKGTEKLKNNKIQPNSIGVTCIGSNLGEVYINSKYIFTNQQINSLVLNEDRTYPYVYILLKNMKEEFLNIASGSAVPIINKSTFSNLKVILPNKNILNRFNEIMISNFEIIRNNLDENERLEKLRDTLLPKLMSGEIRVPLENSEN